MKQLWQTIRSLWRADFFSPKDLIRRALVICVVYGTAHLLGLRDFTSILTGTTGSLEMNWQVSAALGIIYVFLYLSFVLLVPIFLLAAAIRATLPRLSWNRSRT